MRTKYRLGALAMVVTLFAADLAHAQLGGTHRRTRRRTAVVVSSETHAKDQQAAAQQAAATEQKSADEQKAADQQKAAEASSKTSQGAASKGQPLAVGVVVAELPANCPQVTVGGVAYYTCGGNYYRAAFQGNSLVYVTIEPPG